VAIEPFRKAGFAIVAFTPDEVVGVSQCELEQAMVEAGNRLLECAADRGPLMALCNATETDPSVWRAEEGPETGCGIDFWYVNSTTGQEARVNDDQGHYTVDLGEGDEE
jgi:hypothetical protein